MTFKIYDGMAGYTSTGRVLVTLFEKDVTDFEFVKVDVQAGEHKKPEHLELQPFGMIPVLVDGDLTLFESRSIVRYLAEKFKGRGTSLYGSSIKDKALVEVWLEVESQNFDPAISVIVWEKVFKLFYGEQTDEDLVQANIQKLSKTLDVYEGHLSRNKYLAGDFFSLADLSHLPYTQYLIDAAKLGGFDRTKTSCEGMVEQHLISSSMEECSSAECSAFGSKVQFLIVRFVLI